MQMDAVNLPSRDDQNVREVGSRDHGADRFAQFSVKQAVSVYRKDLTVLLVVDVDFVSRDGDVRKLHREFDGSEFFSSFIIDRQAVFTVFLCIYKQEAYEALAAENSLEVFGEHNVRAAGRSERRVNKIDQALVRDPHAGGIVDISDLRHNFIDKIRIVRKMIPSAASVFPKIVEGNI